MHKTQHFAAGILFVILGLVFLIAGWAYPSGTMGRMGAGMFPRIVSVTLILCATMLIINSARDMKLTLPSGSQVARELRIILVVLASVVFFGLLVERAGIALAIMAVFLVSCLAGERRSVLAAILGAVGLAAFITVIFVYVLNIPMKVFP